MARFEHGLEGTFGQLRGFVGRMADAFQRMAQRTPAQFAEAVFQAGFGLQQAAANLAQVIHRLAGQARCMLADPVAHGGFGSEDHRAVVPQGVVEVEGDQANAHESGSLRRLARGWALS